MRARFLCPEKNFKKISTHLLTVLTIRVILHLEQTKHRRSDNSKVTITAHQNAYLKGGMTYDDVSRTLQHRPA